MLPLAVSLGDPAGIGPEIIVESWARRHERRHDKVLAPFFVTGGFGLLEQAAAARDIACPVLRIDDPAEAVRCFGRGLPVLGQEDVSYRPGTPDDAGAALALASLAEAVRMALLGKASGVVTAPVAKAQLARVGFEFPGQTEFLAAACGLGPDEVVMMLAGPSLRAVPVTVHCALADVPRLLDTEKIAAKARIVASALSRDFGIEAPRIAVCGLNPHAG